MNLNKKEQKFKAALALEREKNALWKQIMAIKPIKLDKPIFHGYVKSLEIRPDIKAGSQYPKIKAALELCGVHSVYCKDKTFIIHKKKTQIVLKPGIGKVVDPRFRIFSSDTQREEYASKIDESAKYLKFVGDYYQCNCGENTVIKDFRPHYEFGGRIYLEEKIKEHYLTHYTPIDSDLESRLKEAENKFYNKGYDHLVWGNYRYDYDDAWSDVKADAHGYFHGWPRPIQFFDKYE